MNEKPPTHLPARWRDRWQSQHAAVFWPAYSRTVNVLAVLNVSLFFLNPSVRIHASRFPILSLATLGVATALVLIPGGLHDRPWFYGIALLLLLLAVASFALGMNHCLALS